MKVAGFQILTCIALLTVGCVQKDEFAPVQQVEVELQREPAPEIPVAPGQFSLTSVIAGNQQATVAWQVSERSASYTVFRGTIGGTTAAPVQGCTGGAQLSCTDRTAENGKAYFYRVQAANFAGVTFSSNTLSVTLPMVIKPFALLTAVGANNQSTVTWQVAEGASSYTLLRGADANAATVPVPGCTEIEGITCVDRSVSNGNVYFYRVQATNSDGSIFSTNTLSVTMPSPPAPFLVTSAVAQSNQVSVSWNSSQFATSYALFRGTEANVIATPVNGCANLAASVLTCRDTGLRNGTTYYYRVRATNTVGSLDSSNHLSAMPVGVKVVDVQVGLDFSCALFVDGIVKCWGRPVNPVSAEQFGDGPEEMGANLPAINFGGIKATQISVSVSPHACALLENQKVACWGSNSTGQLGTASPFDQSSNGPLQTVDLGANVKAISVAVGPAKSCAVLEDGRIKCWGDTMMLGYTAGPNNRGDAPGEMGDALPYLKWPQVRAQRVAIGYNFICAVYEDGSVRCWSRSRSSYTDIYTETPAVIPFGPANPMKQLVAGWSRACSVNNQNQVFCWNMGDMVPSEEIAPVNLGTGVQATKVSMGTWNTCAVLANGNTRCWGSNIYNARPYLGDAAGLLGLADNQCDVFAPNSDGIVVLGAFTASSVSAGISHSCVLSTQGTVKCWGSNYSGALGLGDKVSRGCRPAEMGNFLPTLDL
jgi:hypothetical protein